MGGCTLSAAELYLDIMKLALTDIIYEESRKRRRLRLRGLDWPVRAYTMIGVKRLNNLQAAVEHVLKFQIPGDLIETGVWKGGACIFMKAILRAYGDHSRTVWVADSFQGLPIPDPEKYPRDRRQILHNFDYLAVSEEEVRANFKRFKLLDRRVRFLKGWFKDTLPAAPIEKLAVLRLDGDYYESTIDALNNLYGKVSLGGWIIIDDFQRIRSCRKAVFHFRNKRGIKTPIKKIDSNGVYWIKE